MGSDSSKRFKLHNNKSVGNLSILLDEEYYFPSQPLKGTVLIEALQDITVYGLDLKFFMNEFWTFEKDKSNDSRCNEQILQELSINIMDKLKIEGKSGENYLPKGHYNFAFSFRLPDSLNPSFEFRGSSLTQIQLRYAVYCCLIATKGEKYCLSSLNYVIIRSLPKTLNSSLNISSLKNVHSWMFFNQGVTILSASYLKNNYKVADPIELKIIIDNTRGKLKVSSVKLRVMQKISFMETQTAHNSYENVIFEKINGMDVEAGQSKEVSQFAQVIYEKMNCEIYKSHVPYENSANNQWSIMKFQPSIETNYIKCEYFIKISVYFDSFVSYDYRPRISMPLWISHKVDEDIKMTNPMFAPNDQNKNLKNDQSNVKIEKAPNKSHTQTNNININNPEINSYFQPMKAVEPNKIQNNQPKISLPNYDSVKDITNANLNNNNINNNINNPFPQNPFNEFSILNNRSNNEIFEDINSFNYPLLGGTIDRETKFSENRIKSTK
jgi:hypothetical protein